MLSALGQNIYFTYTDDNSNENLIIKSNQKEYDGFNSNIVYFNITNTRRKKELIDLQVHFNNNEGGVESIEKWDIEERKWINLEDAPFVLTGGDSIASLQNDTTLYTKKATEYYTESKQTNYFRMAINYPPFSEGEFWIEANGSKGGYGMLDPWYSSAWKYRQKLTLDNNKILSSVNF